MDPTPPLPAPAPVRPPAVAGLFYPADAAELVAMVRRFIAEAPVRPDDPAAWPKAIIAPHAGYKYSGPVAGTAYASVAPGRGTVQRVVLIGPAHRVAFEGLATTAAGAFATPLGPVEVDREAVAVLLQLPFVHTLDRAHAPEHGLEVHLPFLIETLGRFRLVPVLFGQSSPGEVSQMLDLLWGGPETIIVVSSDLSHYQDYATAQRIDQAASRAIERLSPGELAADQACGRTAIQGLLAAAGRRGLRARTLDLRNSGDTAGPREEVVGYGAYVFA